MSDGKNPVPGASGERKNPLVPHLKNAAILKETSLLLGWIAALILMAGLCWIFIQPVMSRSLLKAVNRVLEKSGDTRRLGEPLPSAFSSGRPGFFGISGWYTMGEVPLRQAGNSGRLNVSNESRALIFTFIGEGTFFPCAAVVAPGGKVQEFIPLSSHGEKIMKQLSPGILSIYARRIEGEKP